MKKAKREVQPSSQYDLPGFGVGTAVPHDREVVDSGGSADVPAAAPTQAGDVGHPAAKHVEDGTAMHGHDGVGATTGGSAPVHRKVRPRAGSKRSAAPTTKDGAVHPAVDPDPQVPVDAPEGAEAESIGGQEGAEEPSTPTVPSDGDEPRPDASARSSAPSEVEARYAVYRRYSMDPQTYAGRPRGEGGVEDVDRDPGERDDDEGSPEPGTLPAGEDDGKNTTTAPDVPCDLGQACADASPRRSVASAAKGRPDPMDALPWQPSHGVGATDVQPIADILDFLFLGSSKRLPSSKVKVTRGRFVGYRRNSTSPQTETSQPRQEGGIEEYAQRIGLVRVAPDFIDAGATGTTTHKRHEFLSMMEMARRREMDVIVIEDLDRFSRRLPDALAFYEELESYGVELHSIRHGKLDLVHVMIMGYMASEGRKRLLSQMDGGKRLAVSQGKQMGMPVYGYAKDPDGTGIRVVVEDRAKVARRIFAMAIAGVGTPTIARTLSEEGIPNPRQCARTDRGRGVSTRGAEGWSAVQVRNLITNPIMMGLVLWGRTVVRRDVRTNEVTGVERRHRSDVVGGRSTTPGIVDEATWVAANQALRGRHCGRGSERAAATVHLLTPSIACACGSPMHAVTCFGKTSYKCVSARSNDPDRCRITKGVRLDWLEEGVLRVLRDVVFGDEDHKAFVERYTKQCADVDSERRRARDGVLREIEKRQELLNRSAVDTLVAGLSSATIEGLRRTWEEELVSLRLERARLEARVDPKQGFERLDTLAKAMNHLVANAPNKPVTPDQVAFAAALRELVPRIVVGPPDENSHRTVTIKVDRIALFVGGAAIERDLEELTLTIDEDAGLAREQVERHRRDDAPAQAAFNDGIPSLPDDAWDLVRNAVADHRLAGDLKPRTVVEGVLSVLKTGCKFTRLPDGLGDPTVFNEAVRRLVYSGGWDEVVALLRRHRPELLEGADLRRMETTTWKRRPADKEPFREPGPGARQELLDLLAASADEEEQVRFRVALGFLDGRRKRDLARDLGLSPGWVSNLTCQYRRGGAAALAAKVPPKELWKKRRLSPEQSAEILALARSGVDPARRRKDGGRLAIRHMDLIRICKERFGVEYTLTGMIYVVRKAGINLREAAAAAFHGAPGGPAGPASYGPSA